MKFETFSAIIVIGVAFLFANFSSLTMPSSAHNMLSVIFILAFLVFSALVWKESSDDEREQQHTLLAGRISFLVGSTVLATGIVFQVFMHDIDIWLILVLCSMILSKIVLRIYSHYKL